MSSKAGDGLASTRARSSTERVKAQADPISTLVDRHRSAVLDPSQAVQQLAGQYQQKYFQKSGLQDRADPWIMAEGKVRGAVVVTLRGDHLLGRPCQEGREEATCIVRSGGHQVLHAFAGAPSARTQLG
jgi:hypothetical protein